MKTQIILQAEGFLLSIEPSSAPNFQERVPYFAGSMTLTSTLASAKQTFRATGRFPLSDLERLCTWIVQHVTGLLNAEARPIGASPQPLVWIPIDTSMMLQLLAGHVEREDGTFVGGFSMIALLNLGSAPGPGTSVYGGFLAQVQVREALAFCTLVREYTAGDSHPRENP